MALISCPECGAIVSDRAIACPLCGHPITQGFGLTYARGEPASEKSKSTAALLAVFLGGVGAHKFYLGKRRAGVIYALFSWTMVPMFIGFVEAARYARMTDEKFLGMLIDRSLLKPQSGSEFDGQIHTDIRVSVERRRMTWEQVYDTLANAHVAPLEIARFMGGEPLRDPYAEAKLHQLISSGQVPPPSAR